MKLMRSLWRLFRSESSEKGQSTVELAITLPLLLTVLCGILDFGWIYSNQYKAQYAAYAGARYASIYADSLDSSTLLSSTRSRAAENLRDGTAVEVDVEIDSLNRTITVTVSYPVKTLTYVAGTIFGEYYTAAATDVVSY